jgi:hypothetical protein
MFRIISTLVLAAAALATSAQDTTTTSQPRDTAIIDDYILLKETKDTVFVVRKREVESIVREVKGKVDSLRHKSIGLGGGPQYGMMAVQTKPVLDYIAGNGLLRRYKFDISERAEFFPVNGGLGYIGVGNGMRIGGGGIGGARSFVSAVRDTTVATLKVRVNAGGFLIEKVTVQDRNNYMVGGYIGGGELKLEAGERLIEEKSIFESQADDLQQWSVTAEFIHLELHGGFTHTLLPWFHIGADVSLPLFISVDGFSPYSDDFMTLNPAARMRFMFGNIG